MKKQFAACLPARQVYSLQFIVLVTVCCLFQGTVHAQDKKEPTAFSLKQCIDYALQNQHALKNAALDEAIADDKVKEVRGIGLPQVSGSVSLTNNDPLRRMFGMGTGSYNFLANRVVPPGEVFAAPNIFQLKAGGDAGVSVTQLLFSSSYLVGLQAAKGYRELSSRLTGQARIQVIENVTKAYYLVLVNQERIKLFEKNIARLDSVLNQTKALNKNGFVEKIDVDRLEVAHNNLETEKEKFNNLLTVSKMALQFQMSMPLGTELTLTEKIADYKAESPSAQKADYTNRVEYSLLQSQQRLQRLDLKNNRLAYLPRIAAFCNAGFFSQSPEFNYFSERNLWYNYGMYGISVTIPIFDGLQTSYKTQQSRLKLQKIENDMQSFEEAADLQVRSAQAMLTNSLSSLAAQEKNMKLAEEIARVTKIKYTQGIGSNLEVVTAETALLEAQTNYYNALYDALVAKVDYDKATGAIK